MEVERFSNLSESNVKRPERGLSWSSAHGRKTGANGHWSAMLFATRFDDVVVDGCLS
jgi:hypothetical protein